MKRRASALLNGGLFPETHRARPVQKLLASPLGPLVGVFGTERVFDPSRARDCRFGARGCMTRIFTPCVLLGFSHKKYLRT